MCRHPEMSDPSPLLCENCPPKWLDSFVQPSRDAADAHQVWHHVVAGIALECPLKVMRAVEILAELERRVECGSKLCVTAEVVLEERFLDPV